MEEGASHEAKFGISEYITKDVDGFRGILKHRYSDFLVNEVDLDGKIIRFSGASLPKVEPVKVEAKDLDYTVHGELSAEVKALFSPLTWTRLIQMSKKYAVDNIKPSEKESVRIDVTDRDKELRRQTHEAIKTHFPNLNSNTEEEGDKKFITISYIRIKSRRNEWPSHRSKFLHFTLCKVNIDTFAALSILSKCINKSNAVFSVAGTKDKRAISTQRVSAKYIKAETISTAIKLMKAPKIVAGDYTYKDDKLRLGDLNGNHFTIALRDIDKSLDEFSSALESLRDVGFINYFGLQRFGTNTIATSSVGLKAVKGDWEGVVDLILKPRPNDKPFMKDARQIWAESKDAFKALQTLRRFGNNTIEFTVLKGLAKNDKDFVGALSRLGRSIKSIYPHAYQSLIWNEMVSKRIAKYGTKILIGDLVQIGEPIRNVNKNMGKNDAKDAKVESSIPENDSCKETVVEEDEPVEDFSAHIKVVDESNLNDYTIYDVVMPQPGHDVLLPNNEIKSWYIERLALDNLTLEGLKNSVRDFDLPGGYRKMIVRPKDVSWRMLKYSDHIVDLIRSDQDVVSGKPPIVDDEKGELKALILELTLPSSSYATMALREVTKEDTSVSTQTNMTNGVNGKRPTSSDINGEEDVKKPKLDTEGAEAETLVDA